MPEFRFRPAPNKAKQKTRKSAESAYRKGQARAKRPARKYLRIREQVLKRERVVQRRARFFHARRELPPAVAGQLRAQQVPGERLLLRKHLKVDLPLFE
jgi:hypothetical protein